MYYVLYSTYIYICIYIYIYIYIYYILYYNKSPGAVSEIPGNRVGEGADDCRLGIGNKDKFDLLLGDPLAFCF